jgi:hypothetical protein
VRAIETCAAVAFGDVQERTRRREPGSLTTIGTPVSLPSRIG